MGIGYGNKSIDRQADRLISKRISLAKARDENSQVSMTNLTLFM